VAKQNGDEVSRREFRRLMETLERIECKLDKIGKEEIMADETIAQVDTDIGALTTALNTAATAITTQITNLQNSLSSVGLNDQQQADFNALKQSVANIVNIVPAPAPAPVASTTATETTTP
jgi:hypothetical protein